MTTAPYEVGILKRWVSGYRRHLPDQHDIVLCARLYLLSLMVNASASKHVQRVG